jgi:hypothetical protein
MIMAQSQAWLRTWIVAASKRSSALTDAPELVGWANDVQVADNEVRHQQTSQRECQLQWNSPHAPLP